jgi:hypothetical protein
MKSTTKISIAIATGALAAIGGVATVGDWRPWAQNAREQALQRRITDLEQHEKQLPKIYSIGNGGE